jgi:hypothetical protein
MTRRSTDLLGRIADARAAMMMRGDDPLVLEMGPRTAKEFAADSALSSIEDYWAAGGNIRIIVTSAMEGFAIRRAADMPRPI